MRNLDIALKDKRNEALCNGTVKTEMSSFNKNNYIKPKQINEKKSKKSQSFFQTKLLITSPFVLNHYQNHYNTSTTNKSDNAKSFHQKYISQHLKEKKTNTQDTPIQNKEKQDSSSRFEKSKSIDISNNKSMGTKKILNITLMSMKRKIMNNPKTHERNKEKSISIEKIKENLDKALNKDKINSNKEEKNAALNNSSLAFFSQIPKNNKQNSSEFENTENNKKSYYQLASLLKEKNFSNKYASNKNNEENASRSRFKSMYTVKTEASSKKQDTQFNHFQNISQVFFYLKMELKI